MLGTTMTVENVFAASTVVNELTRLLAVIAAATLLAVGAVALEVDNTLAVNVTVTERRAAELVTLAPSTKPVLFAFSRPRP